MRNRVRQDRHGVLPADAKPIPNWPDYFMTPRGEMWTTKQGATMEMRQHDNRRGYSYVTPSRDGKTHTRTIHRLVLETFVGPKPELGGERVEARHINGNPRDNRIENLAWGTAQENANDRIRHGTTARGDRNGHRKHPESYPVGERHWKAKISARDVAKIRRLRAKGVLLRVIAERFGIGISQAHRVGRGDSWAHVS